jgi:predicted RNase H-like nuclease (RuvC/YqgF family)
MPLETIRLVSETSTSSQVQTNIETLFAAHDSLEKAKDECVNKYQKERADLIQLAANELKTTADAARAVQKQKDLQAQETQYKADIAAIDYMIGEIESSVKDLSYSNREAMIEVLTARIEELERRSDEAETKEKKIEEEIRKLRKTREELAARVRSRKEPQASEAQQPSQISQSAQTRQQSRTRQS